MHPETLTRLATQPSFNDLINDKVRVKIVDIGASRLDDAIPYLRMMRQGAAEVVGFEPNPEALAKLQALKGPSETYLPNAIGDGQTHVLHICAAADMSSLLKPNPAVLNLFHGFPIWGQIVKELEVGTTRLDDITETSGADLIKMDIQGAELMAMQHGEARLRDALIVQTEVEFLPLYHDQPLFADIEQFLRARGFVLHRFVDETSRVIQPLVVDGNVFAGLSQIVWADAIFIRDFTRLDLLSKDQVLKMAAVLHDCYMSYDLVLHLLGQCDRLAGTQHARTYLSGLTGKASERSEISSQSNAA